MSHRCRVTTVQGIGDLLWTYKKLEPYYSDIELEILVTGEPQWAVAEQRCLELLPLLPRCTGMGFRSVPIEEVHRIAALRPQLAPIVQASRETFEYAVNSWLESGVNLLDIDPGLRVTKHLKLAHVPEVDPPVQNRICLYAAAARRPDVWAPDRWADIANVLCGKLSCTEVALVGAEYDRSVAEEVRNELARRSLSVKWLVGELNLIGTLREIRSSRLFVALQSGLSVLAENYAVPQIIVDYDKYAPMAYTWCSNQYDERFHATTFGQFEHFPYDELVRAARPWPDL